MKTHKIMLALSVAAFALWAAGCEQKEKSLTDQTQGVADALADTAGKAAEAAKDLAAPANAKAQELIDAARKMVGEGKFQDALAKLKEIGSEKLSVDQQAIVESLKAQIEKALAAGSKTASDLIPKK